MTALAASHALCPVHALALHGCRLRTCAALSQLSRDFGFNEPAEELTAFGDDVGWPVVLKTPRGGYDGKGVWVVKSEADAAEAFSVAAASGVDILAEELVDFRRELSALVARSPSGQVAAYPVVESVQRDGICWEVVAPAPDLDPGLAVEAQQIAMKVAAELDVEAETLQIGDGTLRARRPLPDRAE